MISDKERIDKLIQAVMAIANTIDGPLADRVGKLLTFEESEPAELLTAEQRRILLLMMTSEKPLHYGIILEITKSAEIELRGLHNRNLVKEGPNFYLVITDKGRKAWDGA